MKTVFKKAKEMTETLIDKNSKGGAFIDELGGFLEDFLEEYAMDDGFGSERQGDPRGDGRDGQFSMYDVSGVNVNTQRARNEAVLKNLLEMFKKEEDQHLAEQFLEDEDLSFIAE